MTARALAVIAGCAALLAGCGVRAPLTPAPGANLPVAPLGRSTQPVADELLIPDPQAAPANRTVELRLRSEERRDDPFDLPPE
ncbi:hypothetical protein SOQ14_00545 [Erythrobacter sp. T5W1-R]|uniref:hypothetical protein n=1 Tax=Erythrobacter sp. T5W1-R TaxID=3101752 RepID=UPI002AFE2DE3|nr:hypothetical protein [Erythrobacter sp. T5W1-R]MEA1617401.1 hypothetical protein [Erythrobacter sp. T5W1-R]